MKEIKVTLIGGVAMLSVEDLVRLLKAQGATVTKGKLPGMKTKRGPHA